MVINGVNFPEDRIADFCRRHGVAKLSVFGSILHDDFRPDSDVDILVEFDPEHRPGMVRLYEVEQELAALCGGHRVDLINPKFLNPRIRDRILAEAEVQFAEG